jgi:hypothetical protein
MKCNISSLNTNTVVLWAYTLYLILLCICELQYWLLRGIPSKIYTDFSSVFNEMPRCILSATNIRCNVDCLHPLLLIVFLEARYTQFSP